MGISYFNGSGYADPTAHYAVRHIEEEEKMLHIVYPTGRMDIRMDRFFPTTLDKAKKLFRLMAQNSSVEEQRRVLAFLQQKEQKYMSQVKSYQQQALDADKKTDVNKFETLARKAEVERHRTHRNWELLCQICGLEVSQ